MDGIKVLYDVISLLVLPFFACTKSWKSLRHEAGTMRDGKILFMASAFLLVVWMVSRSVTNQYVSISIDLLPTKVGIAYALLAVGICFLTGAIEGMFIGGISLFLMDWKFGKERTNNILAVWHERLKDIHLA